MTGRRFGAEMSGSSFGHAGNRGSQFPGSRRAGGAQKGSRGAAGVMREILTLAAVQRIARLVSFRRNDRCNASTHRGEAGKEEGPAPKNPPGKSKHDGHSSDDETQANKHIHDPLLQAWLNLPPSFPTTTRARVVSVRSLWELSRQRLRNEAYIGAADAAKAGALEILCCTVWTKHSHLRSTSAESAPMRSLAGRLRYSSLSQRLIKNNARGYRDVQRFYPSQQRNTNRGIAAFPHQTMQPYPLTPEKKSTGYSPVPICVIRRAISSGTNYPNVTLFQLLYQLDQIRDPCDRNVLQRTRRGLCDCRGQTNCATLRN